MVKGYSEQRWLKITIEQIKAVKHSDREVPKTLICKSKTTWHQLVKTFFQACHVIYYNFWHFVTCSKQRGCVSRDFSQALWTRGSWQSCILSLCHDFSWGWGHLMASSDVPTSPRSFYLPVGSESSFLCSWFYSTATDPAGVRDWRMHTLSAPGMCQQGRWGDACLPAGFLAARLPLPVFLPERLTRIGTFQREKKAKVTSFSKFWKEGVLFLLPVESYKNTLTCFTH